MGTSTLPFGVGEVFGRTWEIFKDQWALCLGTVIGASFINSVVPNLPLIVLAAVGGSTMTLAPGGMARPGGPALGGDPAAMQGMLMVGVLSGLVFVATAIFVIWIGIGQVIILLDIAAGRQASFGGLFSGGRFLLRVIVATILSGIMTGGVAILLVALAGGVATLIGSKDQGVISAVFGVGMLFLSVAVVYVSLRLSQFYYLILDRGVGPLESLKISVEATRGRVLGLLGLSLLTLLVNLGGFMACGVGLVATIPFSMLLFAVAYLSLVGGPVADPVGRSKPYISGDPLFDL